MVELRIKELISELLVARFRWFLNLRIQKLENKKTLYFAIIVIKWNLTPIVCDFT